MTASIRHYTLWGELPSMGGAHNENDGCWKDIVDIVPYEDASVDVFVFTYNLSVVDKTTVLPCLDIDSYFHANIKCNVLYILGTERTTFRVTLATTYVCLLAGSAGDADRGDGAACGLARHGRVSSGDKGAFPALTLLRSI